MSTEKQDNKKKNEILNSANIVTLVRICLVPVFVVALLSPWPQWIPGAGWLDSIKPWVALVIFILLAATDSLDGYLARSRNQVTDFGKFIDPLADKILVAAALIALVELSVLPSWVVLIILTREFIVSGVRMIAASCGYVIAASWYGKAKTVFQILAITLFILKEALVSSGAQSIESPLYVAAWIVMIIALILTVLSMVDYVYKARDVLGFGDGYVDPAKLSGEIVRTCKEKGVTISTAESLTGGLVSAEITGISGSSNVFLGGVASYVYSAKHKLLDVDLELLEKNGAVNEHTAKAMVAGALAKFNSEVAISTTGVAGPDKDEAGNPVGTVWIAVGCKGNISAEKFTYEGDRKGVRRRAADEALQKLLDFVNENY